MGSVKTTGKPVLGRGLSALFDTDVPKRVVPIKSGSSLEENLHVQMLCVKSMAPGVSQPRKEFNDVTLVELSQSIMRNGLIQPIVVQKVEPEAQSGSTQMVEYRILAGERRWRAVCYLGWTEIPAMVHQVSPEEALSLSLIENIQREDLSPLEEAEAYKRLLEEGGHTQEALASRVGKSRSHIANLLRLNGLPLALKKLLQTNQLSMGHVRALLGIKGSEALGAYVAKKGLNVRQTEALIQKEKRKSESFGLDAAKVVTRERGTAKGVRASQEIGDKSEDLLVIEKEIENTLGRAVTIGINPENQEGSVTFQFKGMEDLDDLLNKLTPSF